MKERKFPIIPVAILGAAAVGFGFLAMNKPLVGTNEEIYEAKVAEMKAKEEKEALTKVSGQDRATPSGDELAASMKTAVKGNMGVRESSGPKQPLIVVSAPSKVDKVPVNEAAPHGQWDKPEFGMKGRGAKKGN